MVVSNQVLQQENRQKALELDDRRMLMLKELEDQANELKESIKVNIIRIGETL